MQFSVICHGVGSVHHISVSIKLEDILVVTFRPVLNFCQLQMPELFFDGICPENQSLITELKQLKENVTRKTDTHWFFWFEGRIERHFWLCLKLVWKFMAAHFAKFARQQSEIKNSSRHWSVRCNRAFDCRFLRWFHRRSLNCSLIQSHTLSFDYW